MARTNHNGKCWDSLILGGLTWRFIHPAPSSFWPLENNASLVVRVERTTEQAPPARADLLFTGDIEERAMVHLLKNNSAMLRASVLEAPHHGSSRHSTASFINAVNPQLIVQSTGPRRLQKDLFSSHIGSRQRLATNAVGAISVTWSEAGQLEWSSHLVPTSHDIKHPASLEAGR